MLVKKTSNTLLMDTFDIKIVYATHMTIIQHRGFSPQTLEAVSANFLNYVRTKYGSSAGKSNVEIIEEAKRVNLSRLQCIPDFWLEKKVIQTYKQLIYFEEHPAEIFKLPSVVPDLGPDVGDTKRMMDAFHLVQGMGVPCDLGWMYDHYDNYDDFIVNGMDIYLLADKFISERI